MENLKLIEFFDFEYYISNKGNVYKKFNENLKELKTYYNNGYSMVSLKQNGKYKLFYVHRLVAESFLKNDNNFKEVNHIDFDKKNNNSNNLEWTTRLGNMKHFFKNKFKSDICYLENGELYESYSIDYYKYTNRWRLRVTKNKKQYHLGFFKTRIDAINKRLEHLNKNNKLHQFS